MSRASKNQNPMIPRCFRQAARSRRPGGDRGSAIIEFALVLLIFLTMLLGIMGFGETLYVYHFVSSAAKSAARWAAVNGSTCGNDASCNGTGGMNNGPAAATDIANYVATMAPPGVTSDSSRLTTTTTWPGTGTTCKGATNSPGCPVEVQVSYTYNFLFPMMGVNFTSVTLASTSEMVVLH